PAAVAQASSPASSPGVPPGDSPRWQQNAVTTRLPGGPGGQASSRAPARSSCPVGRRLATLPLPGGRLRALATSRLQSPPFPQQNLLAAADYHPSRG